MHASLLAVTVVLSASPADVWDQPAMTQDALLRFLPLDMKTWLEQLEPDKAAQLKADLAAVEVQVPSPVDRVSHGTVLSALLEGLGFSVPARVWADWAVLKNPDSKVAIANVAAISCYPPILKLAAELDPKNPVPQVNLGSCAMSAQKWPVAKAAYEKALALDAKHRPALLGLGEWYLHVPDLKSAIGYFARANGVWARPALQPQDEKGRPAPPPQLIEPTENRMGGGPVGGTDEGGTAHVTKSKLELPPLPRWASPDAFILAGKVRKPLGDFYSDQVGQGLKMAGEMLKSNPFSKRRAEPGQDLEEAALEAALKPHWNDADVSRVLALNYSWADERMKKASDDFSLATKEYKRIGKQLEQVAETRNRKIESLCPKKMEPAQLKSCLEGARSTIATSCKESMALNAAYFTTYRDAYARWYDAVKPVIEETYRVQGLWIRQLGDPVVWQTAVMARDAWAFGPLAARMMEEDLMRFALAGVGASAFGSSAEACPKDPPAQPEEDEAPKLPTADKPGPDCPLPKDGLKIPPISIPGLKLPVSFTVWCKEAELKLTTGLGGDKGAKASGVLSVKHRFGSDKSTTVYVGVEAGLTRSTYAATETGVKGELGMSVTFDRNGQVTDVGGKAGVSTSVSLPADLAKGSVGLTAAVEKGAPDVGYKLSGSVKQPL